MASLWSVRPGDVVVETWRRRCVGLLYRLAALAMAAALTGRTPARAAENDADTAAAKVASSSASATDALPKGALFRLGSNRFRQEGEATIVRYSPDGKRLAAIGRNVITLWDARTGAVLRQLKSRKQEDYSVHFTAMSFSPDGEEIAAVDHLNVHLWDAETGQELFSFPMAQGDFFDDGALCYSPDGKQLAIGSGLSIVVYDTANGKPLRTLTIDGHQAVFYGLCWSPDGAHLSAASLDPAVVTWEVESGKFVRGFKVKKKGFSFSPTMSADGKLILAGGGSVVHVWRFATGEHLKDIEVGGDVVNTLILKPDHRTLVVGSQDCKIRVADVEEGKLLRTIDGRMWLARSLAVSPDFKTVALGAVYPTIRQFDLETGDETHPALTAAGHDAPVRCVAWSPDGKRIVSGGENKHVHVWDPTTGQHVLRVSHDASASSLVVTPSGKFVLTAWEWAPLIRVREAATGKEVKTLDTGMSAVRSLTLTPDGKQVIAVGSKKTADNKGRNGPEAIQFWDIESGSKLRDLAGPSNRTGAITFAAGGSLLIAGDGEGAIHVLATETGKEIATLLGHQHSVRSLALSPDGKLLASGSTDQTIRFWETENWKAARVLQDQHSINSVAFSPDGRLLASGSGQVSYPIHPGIPTRIRVWDVETGKERAAFTGHDSYTQAVAFSPDGRRLVSGHDNTTLLIWDVTPHLERAGNER